MPPPLPARLGRVAVAAAPVAEGGRPPLLYSTIVTNNLDLGGGERHSLDRRLLTTARRHVWWRVMPLARCGACTRMCSECGGARHWKGSTVS